MFRGPLKITWRPRVSHAWSRKLIYIHFILTFSFGLKFSGNFKIFQMVTKLLGGRNPKLYSYQASLPRLPVPPLKDTIKRYLRSVRPILTDDAYSDVVQLSEDFLDTIASRLQYYLIAKSWWSSNYVTDW